MIVAGIHQPQYLPWLGLLDRAIRCDVFVILDTVPYSKNYFYNRNRIKTTNGPIWLTVPVLTKGQSGQTFVETKIDNNQNWQEKHWKSIYYAYHKTPNFEEYSRYLNKILQEDWDFLTDLCIETFQYLINAFQIGIKIIKSSDLGVEGEKEDLLINICKKIGATHYLSGPDGANYLNLSLWKDHNITVDFQHYNHPEYQQLFGDFIPNMSVIDLLFNCGKEGKTILTSGQPEYFRRLSE